jgi:hypothetical protein
MAEFYNDPVVIQKFKEVALQRTVNFRTVTGMKNTFSSCEYTPSKKWGKSKQTDINKISKICEKKHSTVHGLFMVVYIQILDIIVYIVTHN